MLRILPTLKNPGMTNNVVILLNISRSFSVFRGNRYSWSNNGSNVVSLSMLSSRHLHNYYPMTQMNASKCNAASNCFSSRVSDISQLYEKEEENGRRSFGCNTSITGAVLMIGPLSFLFKKKEDEETMTIERTIAKSLFEERKGHIDESEKIMHKALSMAFAEKNEQAITYIYDQMANMSLRQDRFEEAESAFKETLRRMISSGTEKTDPAVIEISLKLAQIYSATSRVAEAQQGFRWCLETTEARLNVVQTLASPSTTQDKKTKESTDIVQENTKNTDYVKNLQALLGMCLEGYARFFAKYRKLDDAIELYKRALSICEDDLVEDGRPHYESISILNDLGTIYDMKGEHGKATEYIRKSLKAAQMLGDQESLPVIVCNLASVEAHRGHFDEARRLYRKALKESERQGDARTVVVIKNKMAQLETDVLIKKKKTSKAS